MSLALSLSPVADAVYGALKRAPGVTALVTGGVFDDLPEGVTFPCVLVSVSEQAQLGGLGTKPGQGNLPEVRIRLSVFTMATSMKTAQAITDACLVALADPPAVSGFGSWAIFHDQTIPVNDSVIAGQKVQELTSDFRLYVENQA